MTNLRSKIDDATLTNEDIAEWLGYVYIDNVGGWIMDTGERENVFSLPDWLGNASLMLELTYTVLEDEIESINLNYLPAIEEWYAELNTYHTNGKAGEYLHHSADNKDLCLAIFDAVYQAKETEQ